MRNYAEEIFLLEAVRTERAIQRSKLPTSIHSCGQPAKAKRTERPVLRCRWAMVDGILKLIWSEDHEEPLRCAA